MRIEQIELLNYRQHRNACFSFDRKAMEKDMHIFVADNTSGKTNILNAITWCLYSKEPHLQNESVAIARLNSERCEEIRIAGGGQEKVSVKLHFLLDDNRRLVFTREEKFNIGKDFVKSLKVEFSALFQAEGKKDMDSITDRDAVDALVRTYIPEEVHEFIFFDAERLRTFFGQEMQANVRTGIYNFTQANVIEQSKKVFDDYEKLELQPALQNCGNRDVEDKSRRVTAAQNEVNDQKDIIAKIEDDLEVCNSEIRRLTGVISGNEKVGEKDKEREDVEKQIAETEAEKQEVLGLRMDCVRELFIETKFFPYLTKYLEYIKDKERAGSSNSLAVDKEELSKILRTGKCSVCDTELSEKAYAYVKNLMEQNSLSISLSGILSQDKNSIMSYFGKMKKDIELKRKLEDKYQKIEEKLKALIERKKDIDDYLSHVPDTAVIKQSIEDRTLYEERRDQNNQKLGVENNHLKDLEKKYDGLKKELDAAMKKSQTLSELQAKSTFCAECSRLLGDVKDEILKECRTEMKDKTFQTFTTILSKKGKYERVEIKKDYTVQLFDKYGNQTLGACSAGETNILAYSFTLALQEVSGRDSLLFIDTPLGRIDPENRANILRSLVELADNKQIILLFTPAEFDSMAQSIISGRYSSYIELGRQNNNE